HSLVTEMKKAGWQFNGTILKDRINNCPIKDIKYIKKLPRGSYDVECDGIVNVLRWNYNLVVTFANNVCGVEPIEKVKR
ncbi:hypothetical protein A3Q56_06857, partial [Intoshia linei]